MKKTNNQSKPVVIGCLVLILLPIVYGIYMAVKYAPSKEEEERIRATVIAKTQYDNLEKAAIKICQGDGEAIRNADSYTNSTQVAHPILITSEDGVDYSGRVYDLEQTWKPISPEQIQLVGCVKIEWIPLETCQYYGAVAIRQNPKVFISVYEAVSGKLIDTVWFMGSEPPECRGVETFSNDKTTKNIYPRPEFETTAMVEVLRPFVSP